MVCEREIRRLIAIEGECKDDKKRIDRNQEHRQREVKITLGCLHSV